MKQNATTPPTLAAVCGLYCGACPVYLASHGDPERRVALAEKFGVQIEDIHCDGCRSENRFTYCHDCDFIACATEHGVAFCGECPEYPCGAFEAFRLERPHRLDIQRDMLRILNVGAGQWIAEVHGRHACPSCATINSAYDVACGKCGHAPSSAFVREHGKAVRAWVKRKI